MILYVLTPHKIEAVTEGLSDFLVDDIVQALSSKNTLHTTSEVFLSELMEEYPKHYVTELRIGSYRKEI